MKKIVTSILIALSIVFLTSCATSNSTTTTLNGYDLSKYEYVVFGTESSGDAELDDVIMILQNEISQRLNVVSNSEALSLSYAGTPVLSPRINVKSEKWSGGHTYITINFYDFDKNICVAIVKSSAIGLTIKHDQEIALNAIRKELDKTFKTIKK